MKQYLTNVTANPEGTFEQGFAISGFNFNDRLKRETVIYERVVGRMRCATLREHSPLFEFIWHRSSARSDSILFTIGRSAAAFSDNPMAKPSALYLSFGPALPTDTFRVLFAYFVLRTRRARPSHFRHVCLLLLGAEYRRGCRCNLVRIFGEIAKKSGRNVAFTFCFPLLLARALAYLRFRVCIRVLAKLAKRVDVYMYTCT